mgnify:CR=1 FL=1
MAIYRDLVKKHPTFRERSENPDLATEISLQPYRAYGTDGCILFSDILTPFPGMGVEFDILEKIGPSMPTWTTMDQVCNNMANPNPNPNPSPNPNPNPNPTQVNKMTKIDPYKSTPFVAEALKNLRREVGNSAAVLGFIGLPYTLATYMVEGGSSKEYKEIKCLGYENPKVTLILTLNLTLILTLILNLILTLMLNLTLTLRYYTQCCQIWQTTSPTTQSSRLSRGHR